MFNQFLDIYEPSGIVQISKGSFKNGQLLIVDDDGNKPVSILQFSKKKPYSHLEKLSESNFGAIEVDDLESITLGENQFLYAITSHSLNRKGKFKSKRNQLLRFQINEQEIINPQAIENLRDWLVASYPELRTAAKIKRVQDDGGLNIEGLAYQKKTKQLLIALRSPLDSQGRAIIIPLDLTPDIFKNKLLNIKANQLLFLDLEGAGIRDLSYIPELKGFLLLSGTSSADKKSSNLWFWKRGENPRLVKIKGTGQLGTAEGITPVQLPNGDKGIIIVSDDGNRVKDRPGHYIFIPYSHLIFKSYPKNLNNSLTK